MASPPLAPAKVHYPSSDGRPMAESDFQRTPLIYAVDGLRHHFRRRRDVYVSGNLLIYYREGEPSAVVAPDVFVVLGAANETVRATVCAEPCRNRRGAPSGGSTGSRAGSPVAPGARQRIRPGRQSSGTAVEGKVPNYSTPDSAGLMMTVSSQPAGGFAVSPVT